LSVFVCSKQLIFRGESKTNFSVQSFVLYPRNVDLKRFDIGVVGHVLEPMAGKGSYFFFLTSFFFVLTGLILSYFACVCFEQIHECSGDSAYFLKFPAVFS
jgi:hypothetical protein